MRNYVGKDEPQFTNVIWFYPIKEGYYEIRVYGSSGWQPIISNATEADLADIKEALGKKVDQVAGKSLVADDLITKLSGLSTQAAINELIADAKKAGTDAASALATHTSDTSNPHSVTKAQVGLGSVDNTSDANKPVSTTQAAAIKTVQDDVTSHKNNTSNPHSVTKVGN